VAGFGIGYSRSLAACHHDDGTSRCNCPQGDAHLSLFQKPHQPSTKRIDNGYTTIRLVFMSLWDALELWNTIGCRFIAGRRGGQIAAPEI
jgi:hypothetical protein